MRAFLGAFGEAGHAFPMLALGARLVERGHEVTFETWTRWRGATEEAGMRFVDAPEYQVFPTPERPVKPYQAVVRATPQTREAIVEARAELVVHDILTLAPALAGELEGLPVATLIPHVYPGPLPGAPPYALGARLPRTPVGRLGWGMLEGLTAHGLRQGRAELNETRRRLGLRPLDRLYGGISDKLTLVATLPQLEYPRRWPPNTHVVGPLIWEPPYHEVAPPPGEEPLILVAPSTAQDSKQALLRAALEGLAAEPVRVLAATNRRPAGAAAVSNAAAGAGSSVGASDSAAGAGSSVGADASISVPANARLVDWISYSRTMPMSSLVVTHAGHGTLVRALVSGCPVLAVPHSGDMAENAARARWAGAGLRLPWRFLSPSTLRLAVRQAFATRSLWIKAAAIGRWAEENDGPSRAAELLERLVG